MLVRFPDDLRGRGCFVNLLRGDQPLGCQLEEQCALLGIVRPLGATQAVIGKIVITPLLLALPLAVVDALVAALSTMPTSRSCGHERVLGYWAISALHRTAPVMSVAAPALQAALLNLLAKRCLCNTVGRISTSYFFALAIAISAACSRAAAIVNFARSSRASLFRTFFGAAKSCSTVIIFFKFAPRWSAGGQEAAMRRQSNSALNRGHVMAKMAPHRSPQRRRPHRDPPRLHGHAGLHRQQRRPYHHRETPAGSRGT